MLQIQQIRDDKDSIINRILKIRKLDVTTETTSFGLKKIKLFGKVSFK